MYSRFKKKKTKNNTQPIYTKAFLNHALTPLPTSSPQQTYICEATLVLGKKSLLFVWRTATPRSQ